jgi:transposase-like protein
METPTTLLEAVKFFSDKENCRKFMISVRWADGVVRCPNCGSDNVLYMEKSNLYFCRMKHAKSKFSLKVGTVFEDSPIALEKWLMASWMISNCKNGVSSYEIHRAIGVTQKSAWFMLHRIRVAMKDETGKIGGGDAPVQVDETFVGGKVKNMHKNKISRAISHQGQGNKAVVLGMLETGGRIKAQVIANRKKMHIDPVMTANVEAGSSIMTDEFTTYGNLTTPYNREVINHAVEYVNGHIHTNGIENFWSLLKRSLGGTYISVEPFHLDAYVSEQVFRYNNRKDSDDFARFATCIMGIQGKRLTYEQITGRGLGA